MRRCGRDARTTAARNARAPIGCNLRKAARTSCAERTSGDGAGIFAAGTAALPGWGQGVAQVVQDLRRWQGRDAHKSPGRGVVIVAPGNARGRVDDLKVPWRGTSTVILLGLTSGFVEMPFQGMLMWWPFPRAAPGATLTAPLQGACVQSPRTYAGRRPRYARRGWLGRVNEPSRRSGRDARTTAGRNARVAIGGNVCGWPFECLASGWSQ